ncbi:MAG: GDSL-type esterase/lipase family protein [Parabacteroides sp.]|nr:GDSL-type esterase/lipase family protein [Parabacteroides sp.]
MMQWIKKNSKWLVFFCMMLIHTMGVKGESFALDTIPLPSRTSVIGKEVDSIRNISVLLPFWEELDSLRAGKDTVLTIVHLGDSHVQAGHYTGKLMRLFQTQFGNAGRGWIAPFKLGRTNEPDDYFITSTVREWTSGRCVQSKKKCPIGLGGIGIQSLSSSINLNVHIAPNNGAGYSFNQALFYRGDKAMPMLPTGPYKDSIQTILGTNPVVSGLLVDTFRSVSPLDTLLLHSTRRKQGTDELLPASSFKNLYYGFSLLNGSSGILYHSVGVNGAMFVHYTDSNYVRQLALLNPSLLIVSLGTNETFGRRFRSEEFAGQVRSFVRMIKQYLPHTAILLTTPPECYKRVYVNKKRTYVRNTNTELAAKAILQITREENLSCWDLFTITGGKNSCTTWQKEKLLGRDRIHFTKEGYQEQGVLFYRALMSSYNQYLKSDRSLKETDKLAEEKRDE